MNTESLKWSAQLKVAPQSSTVQQLRGDRIILPQSALEGLLSAAPVVPVDDVWSRGNQHNDYHGTAERIFSDRQQELPHPLTFRLVNPQNGRAVYAGIREFSAGEGEVGLSQMLLQSLGIREPSTATSTRSNSPTDEEIIDQMSKQPTVTIHHRNLPKGSYIMLRPLEAGYDADDWKSLLERYIRDNMTTLTQGEILTVQAGRQDRFRFLVDKVMPEGEAICVVDTDLEVDIQAMNEEQARETQDRKLAKAKLNTGQTTRTSSRAMLELSKQSQGGVLPGEYADYLIKEWDRKQDLVIEISTEEIYDVDVFISPFSNHLRSKPRLEEHVFADYSSRPTKRLKLSHKNVVLEEAEHINISVHAFKQEGDNSQSTLIPFTIKVDSISPAQQNGHATEETSIGEDEVTCKNCKQNIPKRTLPLHEAFCYRNNVSCPICGEVFLKSSEAWATHWHCPHDDSYGSGESSHRKHDTLYHPHTILPCTACNDFEAFNVAILASHRTTTCPAKEIVCQFCHLLVPQQGSGDPSFTDAEVLLSGMTPHEYADGARTTECHLCSRIVRLRDMNVHLRLHDRERIGRTAPRLCNNPICGRTIKSNEELRVLNEQFGLCSECFGPLYITQLDPEGKALRRRVERRLLQQLLSGCCKSWCHNTEWCRTGSKNSTGKDEDITTKDALPKIKPLLTELANGQNSTLVFCVDEAAQSRRAMAEMISAESVYEMAWCVKSLEETHNNLANARNWLNDRAPKINEMT